MAVSPENGGRRKRASNVDTGPRTVYVVVQVLDENGQPQLFDKKRVRILALDTNADSMLSMVEGDENPHAFFVRSKIARRGGGRPPGQPNVQNEAQTRQQPQYAGQSASAGVQHGPTRAA